MKPRLDSKALGLFVAVAESLSFRQAAQALHLSQPPLSRAIRALEERLGVTLFERDTRNVAMTAAGERLLPRARQILRLLGDAEADLRAVAERHGRTSPQVLRLGLTNAVEPVWFDGLAARLAAAQPGLQVRSESASSPQLVRRLRTGRLQAAFIALPTEADGLLLVEIERQAMCVALPSTHRLARKRLLALRDLNNEPMFWFERARQPAFFDHCQRVFDRQGFAPLTRREPADHHVLLAGVAAGEALALLPDSFRALQRRGVVYRPLAEGDALSVGLGLALAPEQRAWQAKLLAAVPR